MANLCLLMTGSVQQAFPGLVTVAQSKAEASLIWGSELKKHSVETKQLTISLFLVELYQ